MTIWRWHYTVCKSPYGGLKKWHAKRLSRNNYAFQLFRLEDIKYAEWVTRLIINAYYTVSRIRNVRHSDRTAGKNTEGLKLASSIPPTILYSGRVIEYVEGCDWIFKALSDALILHLICISYMHTLYHISCIYKYIRIYVDLNKRLHTYLHEGFIIVCRVHKLHIYVQTHKNIIYR